MPCPCCRRRETQPAPARLRGRAPARERERKSELGPRFLARAMHHDALAAARVASRLAHGARATPLPRKPSSTTWPASVDVSVACCPAASRATAKSVDAVAPSAGLSSSVALARSVTSAPSSGRP